MKDANTLGAIGECMLEFREQNGNYVLGYGGDVFNTAVYSARLNIDVSFFTATGDDHYSQFLVDAWQTEGVSIDTVRRIANHTPALYIINTDDQGERSFHYWREASPFRQWLMPGQYKDQLSHALKRFDWIYFSGISLALLPDRDRQILLELLGHYRNSGGRVCFDPNYRPQLWSSAEDAAHWIDRAYAVSDMALPSYDDETKLFGNSSTRDVIQRLKTLGMKEIVLKVASAGAMVDFNNQLHEIPAMTVDNVIDTTAAGDSFNAGYITARMNGDDVESSAQLGCRIAAQVIQHPGAVIPAEVSLIR